MSSKLDIDAIINQLINSGGKKVNIKEKDVSLLCKSARDVFMEQPVFLELEAPIKICGRSLLHFYVYR
jgi:serine/threonine-protein phosphatase PP1 catalytic subunit